MSKDIIMSSKLIDDIYYDFDNNNSNMAFNCGTVEQNIFEAFGKKKALNILENELPEVVELYNEGYLHLNDLGQFFTRPHNCFNLDPRFIFKNGFVTNGDSKRNTVSKPPKHLGSALNQLMEALINLSGEMSGGIGVAYFNWFVAPFWREADEDERRQSIQNFVYRANQLLRSGNQPIFSSVNLVLTCPEFLKEDYGEYKQESDEIIKYICEEMIKGDARGNMFRFPNLVFNITDAELKEYMHIFELTAKFGSPYFSKNPDGVPIQHMGPVGPKTEITIKKEDGSVEILEIEKLYNKYNDDLKNIKTLALDNNNNVIWHKINNIIKNPKSELKQYKLSNNRKLVAEPSHEVFDMEGNKHKIDEVKSIKDVNYFELPNKTILPSLKGILMGFCLGDGTPVRDHVYIQLYKSDKIDYLTTILKNSDLKYKIRHQERTLREKDNISNYSEFLIYDEELVENCTNPNWNNIKADDLNLLAGILSGLISSDGCVQNKGRAISTEFNNKNYEINQLFSYCCFRLGIMTSRSKNKTYINSTYDNIEILKKLILRKEQFITLHENKNKFKLESNIKMRAINDSISIEDDYTYCLDVNGTMIVGDDRILVSNCRTALPANFTGNPELDTMNCGNAVYSTISLPLIAVESENVTEFKEKLKHIMDVLFDYTYIRRKRIEDSLEHGLMPFFNQIGLYDIDKNSLVIGILGLDDACLALFGKSIDKCPEKAKDILEFANAITTEYKQKTGHRWGLFSPPSENCSHTLAEKATKKHGFKNSFANGNYETPYYTNGINLNVQNPDLMTQLKLETTLSKYTGAGNINNFLMGEAYTLESSLRNLTEKVRDNSESFFWAYSIAYSICNDCNSLFHGTHSTCSICDGDVECFDRVCGYMTNIKSWNKGKKREKKDRYYYD